MAGSGWQAGAHQSLTLPLSVISVRYVKIVARPLASTLTLITATATNKNSNRCRTSEPHEVRNCD
ncbi:MAG: hypothetical protein JWN58_138 [Gammaproteobacteria bacterium]|jgi:hypothetical protein|nr:hypothetical protein [Gammaproteobacteria bacterium]